MKYGKTHSYYVKQIRLKTFIEHSVFFIITAISCCEDSPAVLTCITIKVWMENCCNCLPNSYIVTTVYPFYHLVQISTRSKSLHDLMTVVILMILTCKIANKW